MFFYENSSKFINLFDFLKKCSLAYKLLNDNKHALFDDFVLENFKKNKSGIFDLMKTYEPYFWLVSNDLGEFMGVIYLYGVAKMTAETTEKGAEIGSKATKSLKDDNKDGLKAMQTEENGSSSTQTAGKPELNTQNKQQTENSQKPAVNKENLYSAYISICFRRKFWGEAVRKVAKDFILKAFRQFNLQKLKAECFSSNPCAKRLLKDLNFKIEGNFKNDTLVNGLNVDLTAFSLEKSDINF